MPFSPAVTDVTVRRTFENQTVPFHDGCRSALQPGLERVPAGHSIRDPAVVIVCRSKASTGAATRGRRGLDRATVFRRRSRIILRSFRAVRRSPRMSGLGSSQFMISSFTQRGSHRTTCSGGMTRSVFIHLISAPPGPPARGRAGRPHRRRRGRPGSASPRNETENGSAAVVRHSGFSTRFSGSRRLPEARIGARLGGCLRIVRFSGIHAEWWRGGLFWDGRRETRSDPRRRNPPAETVRCLAPHPGTVPGVPLAGQRADDWAIVPRVTRCLLMPLVADLRWKLPAVLLPGPGTWAPCAAGTGHWSPASGPLGCISRCPRGPPSD
jgi:hypothetical protein